jgi:hypothetical protein
LLLVPVVVVVGLPQAPAAELRVLVDARLARMQLGLHRKPESPHAIFLEAVIDETLIDLLSEKNPI